VHSPRLTVWVVTTTLEFIHEALESVRRGVCWPVIHINANPLRGVFAVWKYKETCVEAKCSVSAIGRSCNDDLEDALWRVMGTVENASLTLRHALDQTAGIGKSEYRTDNILLQFFRKLELCEMRYRRTV
jgi:hypothetical protein